MPRRKTSHDIVADIHDRRGLGVIGRERRIAVGRESVLLRVDRIRDRRVIARTSKRVGSRPWRNFDQHRIRGQWVNNRQGNRQGADNTDVLFHLLNYWVLLLTAPLWHRFATKYSMKF